MTTTKPTAVAPELLAKAKLLVDAKIVGTIDEALTFFNYTPPAAPAAPAQKLPPAEQALVDCNKVMKFPSREAAMELALRALAAMHELGKQGPCGHYSTGLWTIMPVRTKNNECAIVTTHKSMPKGRLMSSVVPERTINRIREFNLRPSQGDARSWADICMPVRQVGGGGTVDTPQVLAPIKAVQSQGNGVMLEHDLIARTNEDEETFDIGGGKMAKLGPDVGDKND